MAEQQISPSQQNNAASVVNGTNSGAGGGTTSFIDLGGLKICWGTTASTTMTAGAAANRVVVFPTTYATPPRVFVSSDTSIGAWSDWIINTSQSVSTTGFTLQHHNTGSGTTSGTVGYWMSIGV